VEELNHYVFSPTRPGQTGVTNYRGDLVLGIAAAILFFVAFLFNAADITTNDVFSSTNLMLIGLGLLALQVAGVGSGWAGARRR
jgi:hypothetical protein